MAIITLLPGVQVSICVNGIPLEEYEETRQPRGPGGDQRPRSISKYVEVVPGSRFSVKSVIGPEYQPNSPTLGFKLVIDGVAFPTMTCPVSKPTTVFPYIIDYKGSHEQDSSRDFLKPFIFSAIGLSADDKSRAEIQSEAQLMSNVGEIVVEVVRMSESVPMQYSPPNLNVTAPSNIHEKALKGDAKSHGMNLGAREPSVYQQYVTCYDLEPNNPRATFAFKYRSREALQQLHVLERTPEPIQHQIHGRQTIVIKDSPEPDSPGPAILEGLDPNQRVKAERYIEQLRRDNQDNGGPAVKRERVDENSASRKKQKSSEIMTIDLSGDD